MRLLISVLAAIAGLAAAASAQANDDAALVIGTWEITSDEPGTPWGLAIVRVTFFADGSGIEFASIDGTETSYEFDWRIDPGTPSGSMTITLGAEDYPMPLQVLDRDTIRIASPASADLPDQPMATFSRIGQSAPSTTDSPIDLPPGGVPFTPATVGLTADYSNGLTMTVTKVTGDGGMVVAENHPDWGRTETRYAYGLDWLASTWFDDAGTAHRATYDFDIAQVAQAWPLTPGYRTSYVSTERIDSEPPSNLTVALRVLDLRPFDGPDGLQQAGVVEIDIDLGGDERVIYEYWYVPGFALPVRLEVTNLFSDGTEASDVAELVGYAYEN